MTPQQPKGEQKSGDAKVHMARRLLEESLVAYGADPKSEKYKECLKCLTGLARIFGKDEEEGQSIMGAEMKNAIMAPAGEPGPAPGGAPGGAPPGGGGAPMGMAA
jgi:hypothetical protein